ncbi:hypothetical protein ACFL1B_05485 [Nanoarchaeota archaeon]
MLEKTYRKVSGWAKGLTMALLFAMTSYSSAASASLPEQRDTKQTTETVTYQVRKGDYLSSIAKNRLSFLGIDNSLDQVIEETNRIAGLNGMGSIEEYPWQPGYDCSSALYEDPNCIYPGDDIVLEEKVIQPEVIAEEPSKEEALPLAIAFLAGVGLTGSFFAASQRKRRAMTLESIVQRFNSTNAKTIDPVFFSEYLDMYRDGFVSTRIARYDNNIAPSEMRQEMYSMYKGSDLNLKQVSSYLSEKYGMNISASTVSKYSRMGLGVDNRKEARNLNV